MAISFAFLVLLGATLNVLLALMAIFCVAYVVITVVAIMVLKGWQLGVSECICVVILIGFSVDYVVHLAACYMHSGARTRHGKIEQAYREMGISIMSGMITTAVSGSFLFCGVILTFYKFAVIITSTVTVSFLVSMVLFGAMCHSFGPQDGFCNIFPPRTAKMEDRHRKMKEELDDY